MNGRELSWECYERANSNLQCCPLPWTPGSHIAIVYSQQYTWRSKHTLILSKHGLNFWCAAGTLALLYCTWWQLYPSRISSKKPCNHSCLHSFSLSLHLVRQKVHLVLLSKHNLNMTISHHLFCYNLSVSHRIFCRCLTGLTACTLALQQSIVYRAASDLFKMLSQSMSLPFSAKQPWTVSSSQSKN